MLDHFRRLFAYDGWANREVLTSLRTAGVPSSRALELTTHIFAAEHVWLARLRHRPQPFPVCPEFTMQVCEDQAAELPSLWERYLNDSQEAGLLSTITYKNTIGESWTSRVADILTHVSTHSVYHRGQVATVMRAAGFTPASTDFIHGIRQGLVE